MALVVEPTWVFETAISAVNGRESEGGLSKPFVIHKIMDKSQTLDNAYVYC